MDGSIVDIGKLADLLAKGGWPFALLFILWAGKQKYWVFGWVYEDKSREAEEFKSLAISGTRLAKNAVDVAATTARDRP